MTQGDNNDERERTEADEALHDQPELSTQKFEMLKDADEKQDFESVGADGGETAQGNLARCRQVSPSSHTETGPWQSWSRKHPHLHKIKVVDDLCVGNSFLAVPESSTRSKLHVLIRT